MATLTGALSMSLDGFVAHHDDSVDPLFDWYEAGPIAIETARPDMTWHVDGGSAGVLRDLMNGVQALLIGRRFFEMVDGWGGRHPFGAAIPIVVPVRQVPAGWPRADRPDVHFVTDGLPAAAGLAGELAGSATVLAGGARTIQALLEAKLLDVIEVSLVPVLLGSGIRFFDAVAGAPILLDDPEVVAGRRATHLRYRVRR